MDIRLVNLTKIFADKNSEVRAVDNLNIDIPSGRLVGLLGPSGCGKSTTLYMISGLHEPSSGQIFFGDEDVTSLPAERRGIGLVFQNYALYPHMTVRQNIMFPLQNMKLPKDVIAERTIKYARLVGIEELLDRKPKQLSGGQRQRVAVGRAIVRDPVVFLLDEPLSNLDAKLRGSMRKELSLLHDRLGASFIYVTHDQIEALTLATRIVVMKDGYVQQIATPKEMFEHPENIFVAGFIGTPPCNFYQGKINDECTKFIHVSGHEIELTEHHKEILASYAGKEVVMASRPDYVETSEEALAKYPGQTFNLEVDYFEFLGSYKLVYGTFGGEKIIAKVESRDDVEKEVIKACFQPEKILFFDKETEKRIR